VLKYSERSILLNDVIIAPGQRTCLVPASLIHTLTRPHPNTHAPTYTIQNYLKG